ncbi:peptidyl-prolyl cis-trans isomerase CYP38, chloroplastic-like [Brassica napus]|uniref:peptidyl-prolyl cis-trans isomerase CYP38, chloroplastic-like n=1 Tax=Brassica napus TaxID=3708 RepID=UPI00207983F9|nr:peptidyl-prolyl cis-trans isomerase CYP38, chloroplastic-like [Brassica napus]
MIVAGFTEPKKDHGYELIEKLEAGVQNMLQIVEDRKRDTVAPKQKEILLYLRSSCHVALCRIEEDMVDGFPYEVPAEFINMHLLKGRATVYMNVKIKDNPNLEDCVFRSVLNGYNAPVTAGNFVDLVERHFYDCMEIQRFDGFVVQTGDPEVLRTCGRIYRSNHRESEAVPLEIMVTGKETPFYSSTLEVKVHTLDKKLGLYKSRVMLSFKAFGTMAMAREEFENDQDRAKCFCC